MMVPWNSYMIWCGTKEELIEVLECFKQQEVSWKYEDVHPEADAEILFDNNGNGFWLCYKKGCVWYTDQARCYKDGDGVRAISADEFLYKTVRIQTMGERITVPLYRSLYHVFQKMPELNFPGRIDIVSYTDINGFSAGDRIMISKTARHADKSAYREFVEENGISYMDYLLSDFVPKEKQTLFVPFQKEECEMCQGKFWFQAEDGRWYKQGPTDVYKNIVYHNKYGGN